MQRAKTGTDGKVYTEALIVTEVKKYKKNIRARKNEMKKIRARQLTLKTIHAMG